jgi:putative FmdB family regulatory protein
MPTYDYACSSCGPFDAIRPMADRDQAPACPRCAGAAARVVAGAPRVTRSADRSRDGGSAEQGSYRRMAHPASCRCC